MFAVEMSLPTEGWAVGQHTILHLEDGLWAVNRVVTETAVA